MEQLNETRINEIIENFNEDFETKIKTNNAKFLINLYNNFITLLGTSSTIDRESLEKLDKIEKEIDDETQKIVGIFHTHTYCESILSDEDKNHMIPGMIYVILSLTDTSLNRIRAYKKETENERIMEYGVKIL